MREKNGYQNTKKKNKERLESISCPHKRKRRKQCREAENEICYHGNGFIQDIQTQYRQCISPDHFHKLKTVVPDEKQTENRDQAIPDISPESRCPKVSLYGHYLKNQSAQRNKKRRG
jgi:hypothetical protein